MPDRVTCIEVEELATEYAEGLLTREQRRDIEKHLATCESCRAAMEDMKEALELCREAEGVFVPPGLVERIVAETTGRLPWTQRIRLWFRPVLEPKLALGLAMTLISLSMVARVAGLDVTRISVSDLTPSNMKTAVVRRANLTYSRVSKYYHDLRIVYEIQTQLQAIRETAAPQQGRPPEVKPPARPSRQNKWSRETEYLAAIKL